MVLKGGRIREVGAVSVIVSELITVKASDLTDPRHEQPVRLGEILAIAQQMRLEVATTGLLAKRTRP